MKTNRLNARQLRMSRPGDGQLASIERKPMYMVLDNVMDTYNVGCLFRLADAVAAQELILCGKTETPPSSRIHKAAVGTEGWVPWRYFRSSKEALNTLKLENPNLKIVAVEQSAKAIKLQNLNLQLPLALVVGHETEGVSRLALEMADVIVEIPMFGVNKSLNVVVSTGIVLYKVLEVF